MNDTNGLIINSIVFFCKKFKYIVYIIIFFCIFAVANGSRNGSAIFGLKGNSV